MIQFMSLLIRFVCGHLSPSLRLYCSSEPLELARKGEALGTLEQKQALEHAIEMGWTVPATDPKPVRQAEEGLSAQSTKSLRIEYQLATTVTTQPAIPTKNRTSKTRMIPISMRVSMSRSRLHRGERLVHSYCMMFSPPGRRTDSAAEHASATVGA